MGIEIERKFLVRTEFLPIEMGDGVRIIQGYLSEEPSIRFRIIDTKIGITIKSLNHDGSRFELETVNESVTSEEQNRMKYLALYPVIEKVRYRIPYFELTWEVDVYKGENLGLVTADIELPTHGYPIQFPEWIDPKADITKDPKYFNLNLGKFPFSLWLK